MSWYIRYLLMNSMEIREKSMNPMSEGFTDEVLDGEYNPREDTDGLRYDDSGGQVSVGASVGAAEDDELFSDLIIVEKGIKDLYKLGKLTDSDMDLLDEMRTNPIISNMSNSIGGRFEITEAFTIICDKLAYRLGGIFTDRGFLQHLKEEHGFTDAQLYAVKSFIDSNTKVPRLD